MQMMNEDVVIPFMPAEAATSIPLKVSLSTVPAGHNLCMLYVARGYQQGLRIHIMPVSAEVNKSANYQLGAMMAYGCAEDAFCCILGDLCYSRLLSQARAAGHPAAPIEKQCTKETINFIGQTGGVIWAVNFHAIFLLG